MKTRFETFTICYTAGGATGLYHQHFQDCLFGVDDENNATIIENSGVEWNFGRRYIVYIHGKVKP